jgi:hypothetical protein
LRLGDAGKSAVWYELAAALHRQTGYRHQEASALTGLGDAYDAGGDITAARDAWRRSLAMLDALGHPDAAGVRIRLRGPEQVDAG